MLRGTSRKPSGNWGKSWLKTFVRPTELTTGKAGPEERQVYSPKTEHHDGGESRLVPIFPELLPYLREAFERAEPGSEYVITRYRHKNANPRTQFERIIRRAGAEPWP